MRLITWMLFWALALASLALNSCSKQDEPPYYRFTRNDRLWLRHRTGDEWRFENSRGQRRLYRVTVVNEQLGQLYKCCPMTAPVLLPGGRNKARFYYDSWQMSLERVDSVYDAGQFTFERPVPGGSLGGVSVSQNLFTCTASWAEFVGPIEGMYIYCGKLGFPPDADVQSVPHAALIVRGQQYDYVLTFTTTSPPGSCARPDQPFAGRVRQLYYDRQYGIVRMETITGEVWDRVL